MLNRLPSGARLPPLALMLDDLGNPSTRQLGRALGVTERTARRWIAAGQAPRPAMLALFWVTRWGESLALREAEHGASLARAQARCMAEENQLLVADLARVLALSNTGAANGASWRVLPMAQVLPFTAKARRPTAA